MGSFEWMELQTLTSEIAHARSRLAAASSGGAWGRFLTLNFEFFLYFDTFLRLQFF